MTSPTRERAHFVSITARDLDTDERDEVVLSAARPATAMARERELRELIGRVHPDARFRSFADDVASALGPQHLIVARYATAESSEPTGDDGQGELFAA